MSEIPKVFCYWLLSDKRASLEFMSLHIRFFKRTENLLEASRYRNLTRREREDMRQFGTLAAMAAIWLWIAPLRITNMLALTIYGPQPKLHLPNGKRAHALLLIPGSETKTKLPIRKKVSPGRSRALEVIDFYIKNIRPLHPLAATSPLLFPGYVDKNTPLDDGTVRIWLKRACRVIGFYQINPHFFRHGIASLFLKNNPGAYTHAGRLLDDSPETVRKYYGFIDDAQVLEEAQGAWLQIAGFEEGASKPLIQKSTGW